MTIEDDDRARQQKRALRWPTDAETHRVDSIDAAKNAALTLRSAQDRLDRIRAALAIGNLAAVELLVADARSEVADARADMEFIQRRLVEAKQRTKAGN